MARTCKLLRTSIYTRRKDLGMTQNDLADKLGVMSQLLYNWEVGSRFPSAHNLYNLAAVLDVSMETLYEELMYGKGVKKDRGN